MVAKAKIGALGGTRTPDALLRTEALYPLSYEGAERKYFSIPFPHPGGGATKHIITAMTIRPLGDSALILAELEIASAALAEALAKMPGVKDSVASYETVGVYFEPGAVTAKDVEAFVFEINKSKTPAKGKEHIIPVCYELGPDLLEAARILNLNKEQLIQVHLSTTYDCFAVGFTPGFPYLGYLPERIATLPRKKEPRTRVKKGSIGITGKQTGIYPDDVPGGWNLIGQTPLEIANMADGYFPIEAGDKVRFTRITQQEFQEIKGKKL
jgi:inhibitor of KinA